MRCQIANEELQAYLLDELATVRHIEIKLHLVTCDDCRKLIDDLGLISEQLAGLTVPSPRLISGRQLLAHAKLRQSLALLVSWSGKDKSFNTEDTKV